MRNYKRKEYRICPRCKDPLDAGEHCDCLEREQLTESFWTGVTQQGAGGQVGLDFRTNLYKIQN